jgi:hypothetical protein
MALLFRAIEVRVGMLRGDQFRRHLKVPKRFTDDTSEHRGGNHTPIMLFSRLVNGHENNNLWVFSRRKSYE